MIPLVILILNARHHGQAPLLSLIHIGAFGRVGHILRVGEVLEGCDAVVDRKCPVILQRRHRIKLHHVIHHLQGVT